ncbi:MAG: hypothetical protein H6742_03465 [Alphaproteobacteria bacterium]|nr:hypothetical protein [Alphaproteobacteria bacterium]
MAPHNVLPLPDSDVVLWARLASVAAASAGAPPPDGDALLPLLAAVDALPDATRWAFLGDLLDLVRHTDPRVRAAALAGLRGARGWPALRVLVAGLQDGEADVRLAAARALAVAAVHEPGLWLHIAVSPDPVVVAVLLEGGPAAAQPLLARLLADPACVPAICTRIRTEGLSPDALPWLLPHLRCGHVGTVEATALLDTLPWAGDPADLVRPLGPDRSRGGTQCTGGQAARDAADELRKSADGLDALMLLLCEQHDSGAPVDLRGLCHRLWQRGDSSGAERRLACAALALLRSRSDGLGRPYDAPPALVSLALLRFVGVLEWEELTVECRRAGLRDAAMSRRSWPSGLDLVACGAVALLPERGVDVGLLSAMATIGDPDSLRRVLAACDEGQLITALLRAPEDAVRLLGVQHDGGTRSTRGYLRQLLEQAVARDPHKGAVLLATVGLRSPRLVKAPLLAGGPELLHDVLACLDGQDARHTGRCLRFVEQLLPSLPTPLRVVESILVEWGLRGLASRTLVRETIVTQPPALVVHALGPAGLAALAVLDGEVGLLPWPILVELARAIGETPDPVVQAWIAPVVGVARTKTRAAAPTPHRGRALSEEEAREITGAAPAALSKALEPALAGPVSGLVEALDLRHDPANSHAAACQALLLCTDEHAEVARALRHWGIDDPAVKKAVDRAMVERWSHAPSLSRAAAAWLHRWDLPLACFIRGCPGWGGLARVLREALAVGGPSLREATWRAGTRVIGHSRFHDPPKVVELVDDELVDLLVAVLAGESIALGHAWPSDGRDRVAVQRAAAEMLASLFAMDIPLGVDLEARKPALEAALPGLDTTGRMHLGCVVSLDGLHSRRRGRTTAVAGDPATAIVAAASADEVAPWLRSPSSSACELAVLRMEDFGEAGAAQVLAVLLDPDGPHRAVLSQAIAGWPEGPSLARAVAGSADPSLPVWVRFGLALGLAERVGDRALDDGPLSLAVGALTDERGPSDAPWLRSDELGRLRVQADDLDLLARRLLLSPDPMAHSWAMAELLPQVGRRPEVAALMRAFLARRVLASPDLRARVAVVLLEAFDPYGAVVPVLRAMAQARRTPTDEAVRRWGHALPPAELARICRAAMTAGPELLPLVPFVDGLSRCPPNARPHGAMVIVQETRDDGVQNRALPHAVDARTRRTVARRLAEVFVWGRNQGFRITGKPYRIELIGGRDLGWTRLTERSIYVNPVPMLRGERDGAAVLRGLIVHELGHHAYNADEQGREVWKRAGRHKLQQLHNLVCDEHLERNLRSRDRVWGDDLKKLAAWAFQHGQREIPVLALLGRLGVDALPVLRLSSLSVARQDDCVGVGLGELLRALEAEGSSFARFMRALRMGLGNRHGDDKVGRALALFDKGFKGRDNEGLWEVTLALREIFHDEAGLLDLCDLHATSRPGSCDEAGAEAGVTQEEVDREVERIEREATAAPEEAEPTRDMRVPPKDQVNVGGGAEFSPIHRVVPLTYEPAAAAELAREVARPARKLRDLLRTLGLSFVEVRPRIQGHRLDRSRLSALALRGDPRVLVSRKVQRRADLFLALVVDCSGSMGASGRMERARRFAAMVAEACRGLDGVDLRIIGFTDAVIFDAGDADRPAAHALDAGGGNNDAAGLWHAAKLAMSSRRSARLLIMVSDGLPTECTTTALRKLVRDLTRRRGMVCAQVAVASLHEQCFDHYIEVTHDDPDIAVRDFSRVVGGLVARTLSG